MFYNAIANGDSIATAYDLAFKLELAKLEGDQRHRRLTEEILEETFHPEMHLPKLVVRKGLNAASESLI